MEQRDIEMFADIVSKSVESVKEKIDDLDDKFVGLDKKVGDIDLQVREIKLSLENEVNPKINIIAEGHSILNRKLDEYIRQVFNVQDEREQLKLRMIYLESELAKVKERLNSLTPTA